MLKELKEKAIKEINFVIEKEYKDSEQSEQEIITLACATIDRWATSKSAYIEHKEKSMMLIDIRPKSAPSYLNEKPKLIRQLLGILLALRYAYESEQLQTFQELVRADLFSSFIEKYKYLLEKGYTDEAARGFGAILEVHLKSLCEKNNIQANSKTDTMNSELARNNVYSKSTQKQITAWAGIRNDVSHKKLEVYTNAEIKLMAAGIQDFINKYPA